MPALEPAVEEPQRQPPQRKRSTLLTGGCRPLLLPAATATARFATPSLHTVCASALHRFLAPPDARWTPPKLPLRLRACVLPLLPLQCAHSSWEMNSASAWRFTGAQMGSLRMYVCSETAWERCSLQGGTRAPARPPARPTPNPANNHPLPPHALPWPGTHHRLSLQFHPCCLISFIPPHYSAACPPT